MKTILEIIIFILLFFASMAMAEEKWVYIKLEQTPLINKRGEKVDKPVIYSNKRGNITKGGEWIIPEKLKIRNLERYKKADKLLMKVDIKPSVILPGDLKTEEEAKIIKKNIFGIDENEIKEKQ